jgi:hypothetical protein
MPLDASRYSEPPPPDRGKQPRYDGWWFLISNLIGLLFAALAMGVLYAAMPVVVTGLMVFKGGRAVVRWGRRLGRTPKPCVAQSATVELHANTDVAD